jgi:drug/metabolite transporter (DMT)-like permease
LNEQKTKHAVFIPAGLLFGATIWGVIWYPYRLLSEAGLSGIAASVGTEFFSIILGLILFAPHYRKLWAERTSKSLHIPKALLWVGLMAGGANLCYVMAVLHGEVMRVMLLFYLSPLWTLVLARLILHERPGIRGIVTIALSLTGAFIMLWKPNHGLPFPQNESEFLGLAAGAFFAMSNVLTRKASSISLASKSMSIWLGVVLIGCVLLIFDPSQMHRLMASQASEWGIIAVIGILIAFATIAVQYGVSHWPATRASVFFLFELVVAAISSYFLANEVLSFHEWLGGALIIAATIFSPQNEG